MANFHLEANDDCLFRAVELSVLSESQRCIEIQCLNLFLLLLLETSQCFTWLNVKTVKISSLSLFSTSLASPPPPHYWSRRNSHSRHQFWEI